MADNAFDAVDHFTRGGIYMERPKPDEHFFGKGQEGDVLPPVGKAMNISLKGKGGAK